MQTLGTKNSKQTKKHKIFLIKVCLLLILQPSLAIANNFNLNDFFMVSGFATLGATTTDSDELGFRPTLYPSKEVYAGEILLTTDSVLGVQLDGNFPDSITSTVQLVFQNRTKYELDEFVHLAFIGATPAHNVKIRLGRIKADIYMLSDYRDVGFAYPWARPIVEFYGPIPFQHYDGFDIRYSPDFAGGNLQILAFIGVTDLNAADWVCSKNSPIYGVNILFEKGNWQFRSGLAQLEYNDVSTWQTVKELKDALIEISSFLPSAGDLAADLDAEGAKTTYASFGSIYDDGNWILQSEISLLDTDTRLFPSSMQGYVSAGRRIGAFTPYLTYGIIEMTTASKKIATPSGLPPSLVTSVDYLYTKANFFNSLVRMNQQTLSLGVRWDITDKTDLKIQWSHSRVQENSEGLWLWSDPRPEGDRNVNIFTINLDFIF